MKSLSLRSSILIIVAVLVIDQLVKFYMKTNFVLGGGIEVTDWFHLRFVENDGMAFGWELPGKYGKLILTLFRIGAVGAIGWWLNDTIRKKQARVLSIAVALILAGAAGNIFDSVFYGQIFSNSQHTVAEFMPEAGGYGDWFYGRVVDMFHFTFYEGTLPSWVPIWGGEYVQIFRHIFNVADAAISVGVALLLIFNKQAFAKDEEKPITTQESE